MSEKIDALYEAAMKAATDPMNLPGTVQADPQTVMALVEVYRAALPLRRGVWGHTSPETDNLHAAIVKAES